MNHSFMRVWCLLSLITICTFSASSAQTDSTRQLVSLGITFHGPGYHSGWRPGIYADYQRNVYRGLSVGLAANFFRHAEPASFHYTSWSAGLRASYSISSLFRPKARKMNYYAGLGVSYFSFQYGSLDDKTHGQIYVPFHIGVRRTFSRRYGAFAELGFNDLGFIKLGLNRKL